MSTPVSKELAAMSAVEAALADMPIDTRGRVLEWATARLVDEPRMEQREQELRKLEKEKKPC